MTRFLAKSFFKIPFVNSYLPYRYENQRIFMISSPFSTQHHSIPSLLEPKQALELAANSDISLRFLDGSWYMGGDRDPYKEFDEERIAGAHYMNVDDCSDKSTSLPHMIPSEEGFAAYVSNLGISNSDHVVVYGKKGAVSAARIWWMFHLFGHEKVSILNGGLDAWKAENGPTEVGTITTQPINSEFKAELNPNYVVTWQQVLSIVESGAAQIVDARSQARFLSQAPEPRPGLPRGHIPGSLCVPFTALVDEGDSTRFKTANELKDVFMDAGVVLGSNVVLTCGSGMTACVLYFTLHLLGIDMNKLALYDGSWTEWASNTDLPRVSDDK
mmetsp:Transcript_8039/g.13371  ORF Transcript_8039/g.13371 Transcript_8039/m.13371 type:complete len:329 (-) Transcript_8039:144-1130(-)|eukprot:CAMPEP_0174977960 /NCGR_PEP_ID=MMETSP0004_2-20121128/13904_1 /TAXON_ID=420556 /ORGANISM="Ochromonas sp., Strain CCMP1393" /LENGTH=328 /DNA_ID=CAMNT_0016229211 /DNA_START=13 /DNA_END=999 /DNA_ORIENTATION=-